MSPTKSGATGKRRPGKPRLCSTPCVPLGGEKRKENALLALWRKTIKLPFFHGARRR